MGLSINIFIMQITIFNLILYKFCFGAHNLWNIFFFTSMSYSLPNSSKLWILLIFADNLDINILIEKQTIFLFSMQKDKILWYIFVHFQSSSSERTVSVVSGLLTWRTFTTHQRLVLQKHRLSLGLWTYLWIHLTQSTSARLVLNWLHTAEVKEYA